MMAGTSLMVLLAGIIGTGFAPSEGMATLPIALVVLGVAVSTLPTGRLLNRFGRRPVFIFYGFIAIAAALVAMASLIYRNFALFCLAALMMGWAGAAGHQYRFAALEAVPARQRATFVMAEFVGLSYEQIAGIEGIEMSTVRSRVSRARERLRSLVGQFARENR